MSIAMLHAPLAPLDAPSAMQVPQSISHEAARYAVLRRMGSAIRHQIAGALQPVTMLASLLERRVQAESPNLDTLRRNASEIGALSRSASSECVALMGWIAPHEGVVVGVDEGVADCVHLLATELSFRGFSVTHQMQGQDAPVAQQALRILLPAALMALTDAAEQAAQIAISAQCAREQIIVSLTVTALEREEAPGRAKAYRAVTWDDVQALAAEEGVSVRRTEQGVDLVLQVQERVAADSTNVRWG